MRQNKSFVLKEIANVPYLLPYGQMIADQKRGMQINATGAYLWKLLEQDKTMNELLSLSMNYYEIQESDRPAFEADIRQYINQLLTYGILVDDNASGTASDTDSLLLSIGNLGLQLQGPAEAFPKELTPFEISACEHIHQKIIIHIGQPGLLKNGTVLIRNRELVVMEAADDYILLFPQAKQICEIHLVKDGSLAHCYCLPPYTDDFHYDLFHAIRLLFLYLAQSKGMAAIHSASLLYQDKAWLFSGHSGMGKSTHTNLWKELFHTPLINGDLNLLTLENGQAVIHGIPWCGTSGIYNTETYPIGGIILLDRSPNDFIEELSLDKKQLLTCQRLISPSWTKDLFDKNMSIIEKIVEKIMVCKLHCTKEPNAAEVMKDYIDTYLSNSQTT